MGRWILTALVTCLAGCETALNLRQGELIRTWGEGNRAFAHVIAEYRQAVSEGARNYHTLQRTLVEQQFDQWLSRHTDEQGGFVYRSDTGEALPMPVAKLKEEMERRDQALAAVADGTHTWEQADARLAKAIDDFRVMTQVSLSTNEEIAEARRSAQQFIESSLSGLAAAAGIALPFVP